MSGYKTPRDKLPSLKPEKAGSSGIIRYLLATIALVGLLSFAVLSRQHAYHIATNSLHGQEHAKGKGSLHLQKSVNDKEGRKHLQDHFPEQEAKELEDIGTVHENAVHIIKSKLEKREHLRKAGKLRESTSSSSSSSSLETKAIANDKTGNIRGKVDQKQNQENGVKRNSASASGSVTTTNTGKLHSVTYATHGGRDDRFCRAVESAIRNKYDLVILGWGDKWLGLSQKLKAALAYAKSLPDEDMLLFTDAFDVLYVSDSEHVTTEFAKLKSDIVFSGECGCWPHIMEPGNPCFNSYPKAPTPYRYLNSGTWIGKAAKAAEMLQAVIKSAGGDFKNANDQKLVADFYIQGKYGIKLDFYNKLFQSMHMTLDPPLLHCNPVEDISLTNEGTYYNKRTQSNPVVFHFNGGGKRHHLEMERRVWYKRKEYNTDEMKEQLRAHQVFAPNERNPSRRLRFDQLCPNYVK